MRLFFNKPLLISHNSKKKEYEDKNKSRKEVEKLNIENQVLDIKNLKSIAKGGIGEIYTYKPRKRYVLKKSDKRHANIQYRNLEKLKESNLCQFFLCPNGYFFSPTDENIRYLKLEYLYDYKTLDELSLENIERNILNQLINQMKYIIDLMHRNNMVHTDIKPDNIMVRIDKDNKITTDVKFIDVGSFLHKDDAINIRTGLGIFRNYHYLRFFIWTSKFIHYELLLKIFFTKYAANRLIYIYNKTIYNAIFKYPSIIIFDHSNPNKKTTVNFKIKYDSNSYKNIKSNIQVLKNIYVINYENYGETFNIYDETDKKLYRPMRLMKCLLSEFYDISVFRQNDIHAMRLVEMYLKEKYLKR